MPSGVVRYYLRTLCGTTLSIDKQDFMGAYMANTSLANTKNTRSVIGYIDQLHDHHSKLLVLRVDLGYGKSHCKDASLSEIKRDAKHMLDNRRSNHELFEHQVGYVMKFEHTEEKGPHIHALFVYDGQKVQKDAYLAQKIGDYWRDKITDGNGVYHNCNRDKSQYEQCGIGMIDYSDTEKRTVLANKVIPYMLKAEQSIDKLKAGKERSITKGGAPSNKSNAGRPRNQERARVSH